MMKRIFTALIFALLACSAASAQGCGSSNPNCIVPDVTPPTTSNSQAANTKFVQGAISANSTHFAAGGISTGSANAQVLATVSPPVFSLTGNPTVSFTAGFSNSGAVTLNVASSGVFNVLKKTPAGLVALVTGDVIANQQYLVTWDGTQYELQTPSQITTGQISGLGALATLGIGTGLSSGGGNLNLANTAVTPASYGDSTHVGAFTVDQQGRLTAASNTLISAGTITPNVRGSGETSYTIQTTDVGKVIIATNVTAAVTWTLQTPGTYSSNPVFYVRNNGSFQLSVVPTTVGIGTNSGRLSFSLSLNPGQAATIYYDGTNWQTQIGVGGTDSNVGQGVTVLGYGLATVPVGLTFGGTCTGGDSVGFNLTSTSPSFTLNFRHTMVCNGTAFQDLVSDLASQFSNNATVQANFTKDVAFQAAFTSSTPFQVTFGGYYPLVSTSTVTATPVAGSTETATGGGVLATGLENGAGIICGHSTLPAKAPAVGDLLCSYSAIGDLTGVPMPTFTQFPYYFNLQVAIQDPAPATQASKVTLASPQAGVGTFEFDTQKMFVNASQLVIGATSTNHTATSVTHPGTDQNFNVGGKVNLADGVSFASANDANTLLRSMEFLATGMSFNATSVFYPGVGTTASAANAFLNNASSPANQLLRSTSSRRYKKDIHPLDSKSVAQKIMEMQPVKFHSIASADDPKRWYIGLVAEDMAKIDDALVNYIPDKNGRLIPDGVQYDRVSVLLLGMVKQQAREIAELKAEMKKMRRR